jgi:3-hydroxybutyryl-CoA dehydratase
MSTPVMQLTTDIKEIALEMEQSYTHKITESDVLNFASISGDHNPVHIDEEYAKNSRFKRRIAHGMMSASFFSGIFGTKLPGIGCVYLSQSLNFKRPVYIGDEVTAIVKVVNVDLKHRHVFFSTTCKVKNKIVISGEATIFIP